MDRYKEVTLERKDNKCGRVKNIVLATNKRICESRANKRHKRDIHVCINEMHTHMREIELKEEEEFKQHKEVLKKWEEELRILDEQLEKRKKKHIMLFHCTQ
jgi:hypothetical protein